MTTLLSREDHLTRIAKFARLAADFVGSRTDKEFLASIHDQLTLSGMLELIAYGASHLPADLHDSHPEVPWGELSAMREKLRHDFEETDMRQVFQFAEETVPLVLGFLESEGVSTELPAKS